MDTRKSYQGGSIVTFIVVGVVLAGLLGSGLFALNRYASRDRMTGSGDISKSGTRGEGSDRQTGKGADKQGESSADVLPGDTHQSPLDESTGANKEQVSGADSAMLPQTGSADAAMQFIFIGVGTFTVVSYARSRRVVSFDSAA